MGLEVLGQERNVRLAKFTLMKLEQDSKPREQIARGKERLAAAETKLAGLRESLEQASTPTEAP